MFRWLRERSKQKIADGVDRNVQRLAEEATRLGFAISRTDTLLGEYNIRAKVVATTGLSFLNQSDFFYYGPVGDVTETDLLRVVQVYVRKMTIPQHGDWVILGDRRLTMRDVPTNEMAEIAGMSILASLILHDQLGYGEKYPPRFQLTQIVGSSTPPRLHGPSVVTQRSFTEEQDFDPYKLSNLTLVQRIARQELAGVR